jgi:hypothetical protein
VDAVGREELGSVDGRGVPVDEHGLLGVASYPFGYDLVIRLLPDARDLHVHEDYPLHALEYLHHLVELLRGEGAVAAEADYHDVSELARVAAVAQDVDGGGDLHPDLCVHDGKVVDRPVELLGAAEHHRVADRADRADGRTATRLIGG